MSFGEILKYIGAAALLVGAFLVIRRYKAHHAERKREILAFSLLIDRIYDMVDLFLAPVRRIFEGVSTGVESADELARHIEDGEAPQQAYVGVKDKLSVGEEGKRILEQLFLGLGKGYRDGALALVESCRKRFADYKKAAEEEDEKSSKVVSALVIGCTVGVIILFI
jgi:hypothetical protein